MRRREPAQAAAHRKGGRLPAIRVAVCVPVRDEERALPGMLGALAALDRGGMAVHACLHLDGCTDASAAVVRAAALPFPLHVSVGAPRLDANAGRARAAAMALGLAHAGEGGALLLSTDADSRPQADWLQTTLAALALSDIAAGRLVRIGGAGDAAQARVERYYDRLHQYRRTVDPVPWEARTPCHHGGAANLAFRVAAYRALGGFAPLPAGEDAQLLDDAGRAGFRVRRDPVMVVRTSSRRIGRAPGGLAASLRALDVAGLPAVQHPAAAAWQYARHAAARAAFAGLDGTAARARMGALLGLSADHVLGVARDCRNAESFAMRIVPAAPDADARVPLPEAERALDGLERALCRGAA